MQISLNHLIKFRVVAAQQRGVIRRQGQIERGIVGSRDNIHGEKEQRDAAESRAHFFFRPPINFQSLFINLMSVSVRPEAR